MSDMFYRLILRLIHHILAVCLLLKQWLTYLPLYAFAYQQKPSISSIKTDARTLKKIPNHLSIVVVENEISFTDIANIIIWSVALGISYISVYDFDGEFKRNSKILKAEIEKSEETVKDSEKIKHNISFHTNEREPVQQTKLNGYHDSSKTQIQLLSLEDGRQDLVHLTQSLCEQVISQNLKIEDITAQNIDDTLLDIHRFPDPELIFKFGDTDSLLGFLPWQTRLTEILSFPTHKGYSYHSFITQMTLYGDTKQRFGK